jgi:hypothetical protein
VREIDGAGWFVIVGERGGEPPHSRRVGNGANVKMRFHGVHFV